MKHYLTIAALSLTLAACGDDAADGAQALADCQASLAAIEEEREAYVAANMGDNGRMRAELDGEVSLEEMEQFAEMQTRLQEFENRIAVQQQSCDAITAGQE